MEAHELVIVGCGPAGTAAAEYARAHGMDTAVLSDEGCEFYVREHLNRLVSGEDSEDALFEKGRSCFERIGAVFVPSRAVRVDDGERTLLLEGRRPIRYGSLLVASGGAPRELRVEGRGLDGVTTFYTLASAAAAARRMSTARRVAIVGGGTVALKLVPALTARSIEVTVVERSSHILPSVLDGPAAAVVEKALGREGVRVIANAEVARFEGERGLLRSVRLASGESIPCDAAVVAIGIAMNTGFLRGTGVVLDRGIVVDSSLETAVPNIFAAGDAARAPDPLLGTPAIHAGWRKALRQGEIAARSILGHPVDRQGGAAIKSDRMKIFDLGYAAVGVTDAPPSHGGDADGGLASIRSVAVSGSASYRKLVFGPSGLLGGLFVERDLPGKALRNALERALLGPRRPSFGDRNGYRRLLERPAAEIARLLES